MERTTFIKLDRNITRWGWYTDANTFRVFIHLILDANIEDSNFDTITVHRGETVISHQHLASELNLSVKQIRTALEHLKKTDCVAITRHSKFLVVKVLNFEKYQDYYGTKGQTKDEETAIKRQQKGEQRATIKEIKNERIEEYKNERIGEDKSKETDFLNNKNKQASDIKKEDSPTRLTVGKFNNVFLLKEEIESLKSECDDCEYYINRLSSYIESTGKNYNNHYAVIYSWINEDKKSGKFTHQNKISANPDKEAKSDTKASYDIDAAVYKAKTSVPEFRMREKR